MSAATRPARPRPAPPGRLGRLGRLASGVAVLGTVAALAVVGSGLPAPATPPTADAVVRVPPGPTDLVCPGPVSLPEQTTAGDAAFDPTPVETQTALRVATTEVGAAGAGPATLVPLEGGEPLLTLDGGPGAQVEALGAVPGPTLLRAEPVGGDAPLVGGASASVVTEGDLRGVAAATCQEPSASIWLVGGSTEIGNSALLVVTNPGRTPAEVTVEIWGPSGPVEDLAGGTFLVAPGAEQAVLLEGIAAEQRRLTAHVTAAGGLVSAHLQDSRLTGFTPSGTDLVTAGAAPATRQVVGGLVVQASETGAEDAAQLRLLAPGEPGTARLTLLGADGRVTLPGAEEVVLVAGEVTDVSLAGLPEGSYTAVVDADVPVVAGAMLTRPGPPVELGDLPTLERAWVAAREAGAAAVVGLPDGLTANLVIGSVGPAGEAPGDGAVAEGVLRALGPDGEVLDERALSVPVGTTQRIVVNRLAGREEVAALELLPAPGDAAGGTGEADTAGGTAEAAAEPALAWWVLTTVGGDDAQLLSVLSPVPRSDPSPSVEVRAGARLGLP